MHPIAQLGLFPPPDGNQRWRDRKNVWYRDHEGQPSVRRGRYVVESLVSDQVSAFLEQHHYLGGEMPGRGFYHGYIDQETGEIIGVAAFGPGGAPGIRRASFPGLFRVREPGETKFDPNKVTYVERTKGSCAVLDRFCLTPEAPANTETHILKLSFARAREEQGVLGLVSFSDPVARTKRDGTVVFPGHIGQIYRGKGMAYTGRSKPDNFALFDDATVLARRSITAWKNGEGGHDYVYWMLMAKGAEPIQAGETNAEWLDSVLPAISRPF